MEGQQPVMIWLNAILIALTFAAISSRVGRRVFLVGTWSWHDVLITVAAVAAIIFSIFQMVGIKYGLGLHQDKIPADDLTPLLRLIIPSNIFYFACNWAVKHALLLFYSEIVRDNIYYKISIYFMHFVAFGFGSSSILVEIFQCRPIHKFWDPATPGWCANMDLFYRFNSSIMLVNDFVLYGMPVVFTWHLQLRRPQRIGLNCLFALGGLVLGASAARVQSVNSYANSKDDKLWWFANAMIWSVLENHLAIVVACAPSVKVIALLLFPRLASSYKKMLSRVTPSSSSRSKSRASKPFDMAVDMESGTRRSERSDSKSDRLKPTPNSTPLPSPAFTATSGGSRASRNFAKWFKSPSSPRGLTSADSLEESGLVYVEDIGTKEPQVQLRQISKDGRQSAPPMARDNDIQVETTIRVESARESESGSIEEGRFSGRAA